MTFHDLKVTFDAPLEPSQFRGRRSIIQQLCGRLTHPEFLSSSLVGGPKIGKTSLLRYLSSSEAAHLFSASVIVRVYFDAGLLGTKATLHDFWKGIFRELASHAHCTGIAQILTAKIARTENRSLDEYDLHDVFDAFAKSNRPVALLIDNFDVLLRNKAFWFRSDFFHHLRTMGQRVPRGVAFVTATHRPLLDFWQPNASASPYYNIFLNFPLGKLNDIELAELVATALGKTILTGDDLELLNMVAAASQGHPFIARFVLGLYLDRKLPVSELAADVEAQLMNPTGPLVVLNRQIRDELKPAERQLLDLVFNAHPLTESQREAMRQLECYGSLPLGIHL